MRRLQNIFWILLWPQKIKNDPEIKSKLNVRIEGNLENESCSTTWVAQCQLQKKPNKSQKSNKWPQNQIKKQKSELKET